MRGSATGQIRGRHPPSSGGRGLRFYFVAGQVESVQGRKPLPATASVLGCTNRITEQIQRIEAAAGAGECGHVGDGTAQHGISGEVEHLELAAAPAAGRRRERIADEGRRLLKALSCSMVAATARMSVLSRTAESESDVRRSPLHTASGNLQAQSRAVQPSSDTWLGSAALKSSSSCVSSAAVAVKECRRYIANCTESM